jgi:hypothetical protein
VIDLLQLQAATTLTPTAGGPVVATQPCPCLTIVGSSSTADNSMRTRLFEVLSRGDASHALAADTRLFPSAVAGTSAPCASGRTTVRMTTMLLSCEVARMAPSAWRRRGETISHSGLATSARRCTFVPPGQTRSMMLANWPQQPTSGQASRAARG